MEKRSVSNAASLGTEKAPSLDGARILFLLADLEMGGAERQALLLAQHLLHEENANVEVWGLGEEVGTVTKICEERGIPWRILPLNWYTRWSKKAKPLLLVALEVRRAKPDVILSYLIVPNVVAGLIWRWSGARVCVWNQRCVGLERLGARAERMAVQRVPWFVANSEAGAEFLTKTLGAQPERVQVIHNGVQLAPPQIDRASWRSRLGLSEDTFVACMVANVTTYKDHAVLLHAWRLVIDGLEAQGRPGVLLLAGRLDTSNSTHAACKIVAYDLNLCGTVRFLGQVQDVSGLLGASDIGVLSSVSESSPNGVLEAMAAGLAVVGTENSGIKEAVGPEGYEFLAPVGDAEALANCILRFANDATLRAAAGTANRLRIEREFNPRVTCKQMISLIVDGLRETGPISTPRQATPQYSPRLTAKPSAKN